MPEGSPVAYSNANTGGTSLMPIIAGIIGVLVVAGVVVLIVVLATLPVPLTIVVQSANVKELWMTEMVNQFNEAGITTSNGEVITVEVHHTGSSYKSSLEPDVWSPSTSYHIGLWNNEWNRNFSRSLVENSDCPGSVNVPVGIAMWKPMAELLGWPNSDISWDDIADLALNDDGWSSVGGPQFGDFKYGHGHPDHSNSGLLSVVAQIHAFNDIQGYLSNNDVNNPVIQERLAAIESRVVHYGKLDSDILDKMVLRGPDYLHGVVTYESNVVRYNLLNSSQLVFPLVLVYPSDGVFWNDHPLCIVTGDATKTDKQLEASQIFIDYLLDDPQQSATVQHGVRPAAANFDISNIAGSEITVENGVIPTVNPETISSLPFPTTDIVTNVRSVWKVVKKPATIHLVIDKSGSMITDERIIGAVDGAVEFIRFLNPNDRIFVTTFSNEIQNINDLRLGGEYSVSTVRNSLINEVESIFPSGGTSLYDAIGTVLDEMEALREADRNVTDGTRYIYGIVILSDGDDTASTRFTSAQQMLNHLPPSEDSENVHIYTIAYGSDLTATSTDFLTNVALNSNGKYFSGDTDSIQDIYVEITSEF